VTAFAAHEPHHVGILTARRHEIDHGRGAVGGFNLGFEDQRGVTIASRHARGRIGGAKRPAAAVARADERGEASATVEPWPTEPVDRAVSADQNRGLAIADQGIVF